MNKIYIDRKIMYYFIYISLFIIFEYISYISYIYHLHNIIKLNNYLKIYLIMRYVLHQNIIYPKKENYIINL